MEFGSTLEEQFNQFSIKFLFIVEEGRELNSLLSDLNGLDYKSRQISHPAIVQFVESLPKIPCNSEPNVIVKACHLVRQLISKQKIVLPEHVSSKVVAWILRCCETKSINVFYCEAVDVLTTLFKTNAFAVHKVSFGSMSTFVASLTMVLSSIT